MALGQLDKWTNTSCYWCMEWETQVRDQKISRAWRNTIKSWLLLLIEHIAFIALSSSDMDSCINIRFKCKNKEQQKAVDKITEACKSTTSGFEHLWLCWNSGCTVVFSVLSVEKADIYSFVTHNGNWPVLKISLSDLPHRKMGRIGHIVRDHAHYVWWHLLC